MSHHLTLEMCFLTNVSPCEPLSLKISTSAQRCPPCTSAQREPWPPIKMANSVAKAELQVTAASPRTNKDRLSFVDRIRLFPSKSHPLLSASSAYLDC